LIFTFTSCANAGAVKAGAENASAATAAVASANFLIFSSFRKRAQCPLTREANARTPGLFHVKKAK